MKCHARLAALLVVSCLSLLASTAAAQQPAEIVRTIGGFVTPGGMFRVDADTGHGVFVSPLDFESVLEAELVYHSTSKRVLWYRAKGTPYYVGFEIEADRYDLYPVWLTYYGDDTLWHTSLLGMSKLLKITE